MSITQTPFTEEMKTEEEETETETDKETVETTEEQKKKRRELIHAYLTSMMDNKNEQTKQDKTETYLRTSIEEEYDNEGEWTTQFSYPTEEENTLFMIFMTGNVKNQKT